MDKVVINSKDITLTHVSSRDIGKTFRLDFTVTIDNRNTGKVLSMRDIDSISLKDAIIGKIPEKDKDFFDLVDFDHTGATFYLKTDDWLKKITSGMKGKANMSNFTIEFKLATNEPILIKRSANMGEWDDFVLRKTKQWISEKRSREMKFLQIIFPKSYIKKISNRLSYMFDWSYDSTWNKLTAHLKGEWIVALIYAISELTKQSDLNKERKMSKYYLFSTAVKKELSVKDQRKGSFLSKYLTKKNL